MDLDQLRAFVAAADELRARVVRPHGAELSYRCGERLLEDAREELMVARGT